MAVIGLLGRVVRVSIGAVNLGARVFLFLFLFMGMEGCQGFGNGLMVYGYLVCLDVVWVPYLH